VKQLSQPLESDVTEAFWARGQISGLVKINAAKIGGRIGSMRPGARQLVIKKVLIL